MSEPVEHKLQNVIADMRRLYHHLTNGGWLQLRLDLPRLGRAIETLEQSDTKIAHLIAERDELYMKLLAAHERADKLSTELSDAGWRLEQARQEASILNRLEQW